MRMRQPAHWQNVAMRTINTKCHRTTQGSARQKATATRFELARAEPIGFRDQLLNHSDTLSYCSAVAWLRLHLRKQPANPEKLDSPGFEPGAFCMQSRRDTTTPQALQCSRLLPASKLETTETNDGFLSTSTKFDGDLRKDRLEGPLWPTQNETHVQSAKTSKRAAPGIEPGTSRTRSGNHTTRPKSHEDAPSPVGRV